MDINFLLVGILLLLLVSGIHGYRKGFLRMAISLVCLVTIIMVVPYISPYVSQFVMEKTSVYDNVRERILENISEKDAVSPNENVLAEDIYNQEENHEQRVKALDLPLAITEVIIENSIGDEIDSSSNIFEEYISSCLAKMVVKAGTFIGLVAILWVTAYILLLAAHFLNKIPVLKTFNKLLGLGSGLIIGVTIVWLGFLVVIAFFGEDISSAVLKDVEDSQILTYLFNTNPLLQYIK